MPTNRSRFFQNCRSAGRDGGRWLTIGLVLFLFLSAGVRQMAAEEPLAVDLLYFRGESGDNEAQLEWETGTEDDVAGFRLERANSSTGPFSTLDDIGIIGAEGSVSAGAYYQRTDETAINGQTYWYKLVEITTSNTVGNEWTLRLEIEPEPTSQIIGGGGSSATSTLAPTSTRQPTATNPPTNTPAPSPTGDADDDGAQATNTPRPSNTPRPTSTRQQPASPTPDDDGAAATTRTFTAGATATARPGDGEEESVVSATLIAAIDAQEAGRTAPASAETSAARGEEGALSAGEAEAAANEEEDSPLLGGRSIGAGDAGGADDETASAQQEEGESSSLLLWLGFLAALFIFVGGVAFSIYLSTRKRRNDQS